MRTIYLVRHAEYDTTHGTLPGRLPTPLSEKGLEQAAKMKDYFADKTIRCIYSSAVGRCKQTSGIISDGKIPIIYDQRLLEVFSAYQGYDNQGKDEVHHFYSSREELGGESFEDVGKRIFDFYREIGSLLDNVILCSHGDVHYFLYLQLIGEKVPHTVDEYFAVRERVAYQGKGSVRILRLDEQNKGSSEELLQF